MQKLEKILEEIKGVFEQNIVKELNDDGTVDKYSLNPWHTWHDIEEVIRKHIDDGWIPVEERLPEEGQEVWISTKYGTERVTYTEHLVNQRVRVFLKIGGTMSVEEVSAWQPYHVPDPYTP